MAKHSAVVVDLGAERSMIDAVLSRVDHAHMAGLPTTVADAMRYGVRGPGKRMRGILVGYAYRAAGGTCDVSQLAAAVEILHAYSLLHDDLPCMDDDDMRRGRPTVHKVYGVRTAVIAGMTMIPMAVRYAVSGANAVGATDHVRSMIVRTLMHAAGAAGMIGGQWLDLSAEGESLTLTELEKIHRAKTGALIMASARIGAYAANADDDVVDALSQYGADLGLAFQIVDDVLDVTATTDQLGKSAGRDEALHKSTYPALLGVQGAIERARSLIRDGCATLESAGLLTPELRHLADLVITRTN